MGRGGSGGRIAIQLERVKLSGGAEVSRNAIIEMPLPVEIVKEFGEHSTFRELCH
jgi:hypothetical protein